MTHVSPHPRATHHRIHVSVHTAPRGHRGIATTTQPVLTVLVPTRNEAENVEPLVARLAESLVGLPCEVLFVDDSDDATPVAVEALADRPGRLDVRLLHRARGDRADGLSGAVVAGLRRARGTWVCVMDGDLQHPPEVILSMLDAARTAGADVVVASRYCSGGDAAGLSGWSRRVVSRAASGAATLLFRDALRHVSDPMSGFFLFRRGAVDAEALRPRGFKILLEIAVRTPGLRVAEVPFVFEARNAGESKADGRVAIAYLLHLVHLRISVTRTRLSGRTSARIRAGSAPGSVLESRPS